MDYETAVRVYQAVRSSSQTHFADSLIDTAVRYARLRVDWLLADPDRQADVDADRTTCHNALIAACDILARSMAAAGEDTSWRRTLGTDRKRIGDFACFVHCILGLRAR